MTVLDAAYWVACVVLVVSGLSKLPESSGLEAALVTLGLPVPAGTGRVLGAAEVVLGALGLALAPGGAATVVAVLVAVTYVVFAGIVEAARRRGLRDCGCVGVRPSPPTVLHAVLNGGLALVAAAAAVAGPIGVLDGLADMAWWWAVLIALAVSVAAGLVIARQSSG